MPRPARRLPVLLLTLLLAALPACAQTSHPRPGIGSTVLYEANTRQMTEAGTFDALRERLPAIKALGVGVLWLMPIHPIGEEKRLGTLGSYYAVRDYTAVNPEFGTKEDLDELIAAAHELGMLVILDWVPNHTAWDHPWITEHPERYTRDEDGEIVSPMNWSDVADLNFDEPSTATAMIEAMRYWIETHDIDGFRCDYAEGVPAEFWTRAIDELRRIKPLFFLAEAHAEWLLDCGFDALFGWGAGDGVLHARRNDGDTENLRGYLDRHVLKREHLVRETFRVHFTSNHDWNSWDGTALDRFGPAWEAGSVLIYTLPGMPMVYSGQEAGIERQLQFFEKDRIEWREHPSGDLLRKLGAIKSRNPALRHGDRGASYQRLRLADDSSVLAFKRRKGADEVVVVVNLSPETVAINPTTLRGTWTDLDGQPANLPESLPAWGWVVLEKTD
ncbi:MAG: alpha-amylase family glycosyl hydrolase [Phycisphaerales bacterium JB040]